MKQLLVFLFLLCSTSMFAQDVIVKKDGSTIVCRVVELTSSEIVYKKWSDLNGSNYVMNRADASVINYENGKKVNLSEGTNLYMPNNQNDGIQQYNDRTLLLLDNENNIAYKKVRTFKNIGWIGGAAFLVGGGIVALLGTDDCVIVGASIAGGSLLWTPTFLLLANHQRNNIQSTRSFSFCQYNFELSKGSSFSASLDVVNEQWVGKRTLGLGVRYYF